MNNQPVRKLNKRLIYWCLIGMIVLSLPALISLASFNKPQRASDKAHEAHANIYAHDAKAITGTEHFPETYGDVQKFEKDSAVVGKKKDSVAEALAELEKEESLEAPRRASAGYRQQNDDPWQEAQKKEQKQRAFDHHDAKRSDIMFVDNLRNKRHNQRELESEEELAKLVDDMPSADPNDDVLLAQKTRKNSQRHVGHKNSLGTIQNPSPYMLSEGTLIHAILLSEINTDLPGPIIARVSNNIWDSKTGQTLLIPQNSKLIGEYNASVGHGQKRAQIAWTRIIYPNQQSVNLGSMVGVDKKGTSGTAGKVDNHYDKVALALVMTTALGASVRMTQGKYDSKTASIGDDIGNSLAQETTRIGSHMADQMLSVKPTITVPIGERLNVFVEQDLHLEPYSG